MCKEVNVNKGKFLRATGDPYSFAKNKYVTDVVSSSLENYYTRRCQSMVSDRLIAINTINNNQ